MDAKITKKRLGLLLSYDWIKIAAICAAAVVLWLVLLTSLATRATKGQCFDIYTYIGVRISTNELGTLETLREKNALSDDVLDLTTYTLTQDGYEDMILSVRFQTGEGDVLLVADTQDTVDESGQVTQYGGLRDYLSGYMSYSACLNTDLSGYEDQYGYVYTNYFADCEAYLNGFFFTDGEPDYENGTLDKQIAETRFRERIKKDKRYKKEEQKAAAALGEFERLENLRTSYVRLKGWVTGDDENAPIRVRTCNAPADTNGDGVISAGEGTPVQFAFDLSNLENITSLAGNTSNAENMAQDLCMVIVETGSSSETDMRFEQITFLTYLADKYDA